MADLDSTDTPVGIDTTADDSDGLLSRVALIEQRPLEERAEAFTRLYDELRTALDRADTPTDG